MSAPPGGAAGSGPTWLRGRRRRNIPNQKNTLRVFSGKVDFKGWRILRGSPAPAPRPYRERRVADSRLAATVLRKAHALIIGDFPFAGFPVTPANLPAACSRISTAADLLLRPRSERFILGGEIILRDDPSRAVTLGRGPGSRPGRRARQDGHQPDGDVDLPA